MVPRRRGRSCRHSHNINYACDLKLKWEHLQMRVCCGSNVKCHIILQLNMLTYTWYNNFAAQVKLLFVYTKLFKGQ